MRIAICISGQSRTWKISSENIKRYFNINGCQVDYFIHTWDLNSYRRINDSIDNRMNININNIEKEIRDSFNPVSMIFEKFDSNKYTHWMPMFYSFMKSVWLKRKYELEKDFIYDLVVKTRFDVNFPQEGINERGVSLDKFDIPEILPLVAYNSSKKFDKFPYECNYNSFYDVLFYSDSSTMDIISNLYQWYSDIIIRSKERISRNESVEDVEYFYGPGTLLYQYLNKYGIFPYSEISIPHYIVRLEAEELGLDGIKDWKKILEISDRFYDEHRKIGTVK